MLLIVLVLTVVFYLLSVKARPRRIGNVSVEVDVR
jgi:hypothetical protein